MAQAYILTPSMVVVTSCSGWRGSIAATFLFVREEISRIHFGLWCSIRRYFRRTVDKPKYGLGLLLRTRFSRSNVCICMYAEMCGVQSWSLVRGFPLQVKTNKVQPAIGVGFTSSSQVMDQAWRVSFTHKIMDNLRCKCFVKEKKSKMVFNQWFSCISGYKCRFSLQLTRFSSVQKDFLCVPLKP